MPKLRKCAKVKRMCQSRESAQKVAQSRILILTAIFFQILSQDENPGIEFEYSLPSGAFKETPEGGETYEWQVKNQKARPFNIIIF